jgi:hypothetical protein
MTKLNVKTELIGKKLHRLEVYHDGKFIGEYERSQAKDIERKTKEVNLASDLLLSIYREYGAFIVRWDGVSHKKSVRVNGTEVSIVPKGCWLKPSWE